MVALRNLILTLFFLTSSLVFAGDLKLQPQDLSDYMSPAELMQDFGIDPDGVMWQADFSNPRLYIIVDKAEHGTSPTAQTLEAILDGKSIYRFKVSTGKEEKVTTPSGLTYFATTPTGQYKIYFRDRDHKSKKWKDAEMPFAQFFIGGIAIHATVPMHFDMIGHRDSGGCVRLMPKNAEIMWDLVGKIGTNDTQIIVFDGSKEVHPDVLGSDPTTPASGEGVKSSADKSEKKPTTEKPAVKPDHQQVKPQPSQSQHAQPQRPPQAQPQVPPPQYQPRPLPPPPPPQYQYPWQYPPGYQPPAGPPGPPPEYRCDPWHPC